MSENWPLLMEKRFDVFHKLDHCAMLGLCGYLPKRMVAYVVITAATAVLDALYCLGLLK